MSDHREAIAEVMWKRECRHAETLWDEPAADALLGSDVLAQIRAEARARRATVRGHREVTDPIHAGGCYYRHQQGETDECNSCAAHQVESAVRAALTAEGAA